MGRPTIKESIVERLSCPVVVESVSMSPPSLTTSLPCKEPSWAVWSPWTAMPLQPKAFCRDRWFSELGGGRSSSLPQGESPGKSSICRAGHVVVAAATALAAAVTAFAAANAVGVLLSSGRLMTAALGLGDQRCGGQSRAPESCSGPKSTLELFRSPWPKGFSSSGASSQSCCAACMASEGPWQATIAESTRPVLSPLPRREDPPP
mmetsp:Transcript_218/g.813  ORF Transcript_218/g.813 Transcript_218/m.813 type:complete len:206 (-) Transcript_218:20-637(-)